MQARAGVGGSLGEGGQKERLSPWVLQGGWQSLGGRLMCQPDRVEGCLDCWENVISWCVREGASARQHLCWWTQKRGVIARSVEGPGRTNRQRKGKSAPFARAGTVTSAALGH